MKIVLCIKQVPDTSDIKWTENNTIQREGLESIINPYDVYAMEAALKLKRSYNNIEITALTMGPSQAEDMLKKAISVGVDNAILLTDRKFAAADTYATGKTIGTAIKTKKLATLLLVPSSKVFKYLTNTVIFSNTPFIPFNKGCNPTAKNLLASVFAFWNIAAA